jgi:hypothetical protein
LPEEWDKHEDDNGVFCSELLALLLQLVGDLSPTPPADSYAPGELDDSQKRLQDKFSSVILFDHLSEES